MGGQYNKTLTWEKKHQENQVLLSVNQSTGERKPTPISKLMIWSSSENMTFKRMKWMFVPGAKKGEEKKRHVEEKKDEVKGEDEKLTKRKNLDEKKDEFRQVVGQGASNMPMDR